MPYCDIRQVNQLTALLPAHGVRDVVACPGSRNAPIIHNLHETGRVRLHPLTDERSAAFAALGMTLATQEPAAVCVTSGSALLNCLPAVAEAYHRHLPLLVISADRPPQWVGQLDGQTLPQQGALQPYCPTFQLQTPHSGEEAWLNNRLINEALLSLTDNGGGPAHINIAIDEPLFSFTTENLPAERVVRKARPADSRPVPPAVIQAIIGARLPALLIGQYEGGDLREAVERLDRQGQLLVLPDFLADARGSHRANAFDALSPQGDAALLPDVVVQTGGNFVHKRFKELLRRTDCTVIRIGQDRRLTDTFLHLDTWVEAAPPSALSQMADELPQGRDSVRRAAEALDKRWAEEAESLGKEAERRDGLTFHFVLLALRERLERESEPFSLHLGNSTSVRAAARVFAAGDFPIFCNRGVNGIEGSLSAAAGYAMRMWGKTIAILGDLSFFYDTNALWNVSLPDGLRVLLLNDGHGGIFDRLPGLELSPARNRYIAAGGRRYSAEGLARTFGLGYHRAESKRQLPDAIDNWLRADGAAQLLEVTLP